MGDHTETLQIEYDPTQLSYQTLLDLFWNSHSPTQRKWSQQYKAAVFYHSEAQRQLATKTKNEQAITLNSEIHTEIIPFTAFYRAEDYHQKYMLRQTSELMKEFNAIYPDPIKFTDSTAAARVNGYVGGYGTLSAFEIESGHLGLSPAGNKTLLKLVERFNRHYSRR